MLTKERFPESVQDLAPLTESFVEARYSLHPIPDERGVPARRWWQGFHKLLSREERGR